VADLELVWPSTRHLPSYTAALEKGWSPDNVRGAAAAREELSRIRENPEEFLRSLVDREAKGPPIDMPDGSTVARLRVANAYFLSSWLAICKRPAIPS
jgi:hypothetical protein